jgi:predicted dehydrogenase
MYRVGIIGVGQIAYSIDHDNSRKFIWSHAKAYEFHRDTNLVAVTDLKNNINTDFIEDYPEVIFYDNYLAMIKSSRLEFVSICSPTPTHLEVVSNIASIDSIKGIFLEKPVGKNYEDSLEISQICQENNIVLISNYMRRWDYKYNHIEEVISNNSLGKLQTIIASGNTSLLTSACHLIDLMLMYGKDEDWVVGDLQQDYIRNVDGIQDHGGSAMIKFKSGVCGFLRAVSKTEKNLMFSIDLYFEDGNIKIYEPWTNDDQSILEVMRFLPREDDRYNALYADNSNLFIKKNERMLDAISDMIKCVKKGGIPKSGSLNALKVHKVIENIKLSSFSGRPINYDN